MYSFLLDKHDEETAIPSSEDNFSLRSSIRNQEECPIAGLRDRPSSIFNGNRRKFMIPCMVVALLALVNTFLNEDIKGRILIKNWNPETDEVEYDLVTSIEHDFVINKTSFAGTISGETTNIKTKNNRSTLQNSSSSSKSPIASPRVALLMSFPNSGTTYTLKFIQGATQTTTATNYGAYEQPGYNTSIALDHSLYNINHNDTITNKYSSNGGSRFSNGPFLRYPDRALPPHNAFLLTKTHCESSNVRVNIDEFNYACRTGNAKIDRVQYSPVTYDTNIPQAAVHLIRNPFDNIVARLHYQQKQKWSKSNETLEQEMLQVFTDTKKGFHRWCFYNDQVSEKKHRHLEYIIEELKALLPDDEDISTNTTMKNVTTWQSLVNGGVPCLSEFYRYFHWHNLAIELTTKEMKIPTLYLYYENYQGITQTTRTTATTNKTKTSGNYVHTPMGPNTSTTEATLITQNNITTTLSPAAYDLLSFLHFDPLQHVTGIPPEFIQGKTYQMDYFGIKDRIKITQLAKAVLTSTAWDLMEHYFETDP